LTLVIIWHKSVSKSALIGWFSFKTAPLRDSQKNGPCLETPI
jgi:hypothetical protein